MRGESHCQDLVKNLRNIPERIWKNRGPQISKAQDTRAKERLTLPCVTLQNSKTLAKKQTRDQYRLEHPKTDLCEESQNPYAEFDGNRVSAWGDQKV